MTDPVAQFAEWWNGDAVPVVVATVSPDGRPSARAVVLEGFDDNGFFFWSSSESPKGRDLAANPHAALVFLWDDRQVRVEGRVKRVPDEENDRHWRTCDGKRQLAAFRQSEPIGSREQLEQLVERVPEDPPRPPFWVGYRVVPERVEFWELDDDFVHDRFRFDRVGPEWKSSRLQP